MKELKVRRRTPETRAKLDIWIESNREKNTCPMCENVATKEYVYWKIQTNDFPYDFVAKKHDLLTLKRHEGDPNKLTQNEIEEYHEIVRLAGKEYDSITLNLGKTRSIPNHLHYHLLEYIDDHI